MLLIPLSMFCFSISLSRDSEPVRTMPGLKLKQLNGIQPSVILLSTQVLFLLPHVIMSSVKNVSFGNMAALGETVAAHFVMPSSLNK